MGLYKKLTPPHQEVVEISPGKHVDRSGWDDNVLDYDKVGREIPILKEAHLLERRFRGSLVIGPKGSPIEAWAGYGGAHDELSPAEWSFAHSS